MGYTYLCLSQLLLCSLYRDHPPSLPPCFYLSPFLSLPPLFLSLPPLFLSLSLSLHLSHSPPSLFLSPPPSPSLPPLFLSLSLSLSFTPPPLSLSPSLSLSLSLSLSP